MRQSHKFLATIDSSFYRRYLQQMLMIVAVLLFSLVSGPVSAIEANPGSSLNCPANSTKGFLSNGSYSRLVTSFTSNSYQNVVSNTEPTGNTNANIPLKIKMSVESSGESAANSTPALYGSSPQAISFIGSPSSRTPSTAITLEFRNSSNNQTVFLDQVAMSAFDIDKSVNRGSWDDNVKITGITQSGASITGTFQNIPNSRVIGSSSGLRLPSTPDDDNCTGSLQSDCQGSVVFDEPVKSVTLVYADLKSNRTITSRRFEFRLDSYCYKPMPAYSITKSDGVDSIGTNNITNYTIKVNNIGEVALSNIVLKDPATIGLNKSANISCDSTVSANTCSSSTTLPTKAELEGLGYSIPTLAAGKSYSIVIPTTITAAANSIVNNVATISHPILPSESASDTNTVTSTSGPTVSDTALPPTCPANHKMYYLGAKPPSHTPIATKSLSWSGGSGNTSTTFTFSDNTKLKLSFSEVVNVLTASPYYDSVNGVTSNAINMSHSSQQIDINHKLTASIDRPVSKYGFVVQDLDSNEGRQYTESISLITLGGIFSNFRSSYFTQSNSNRTITGVPWQNCSNNNCDFNIDWGAKASNVPFISTHGNTYSSSTPSNGEHIMGYSDFYFCLAPPKLVIKKELTEPRINDTDDNRDQFNIKVRGGDLKPDDTGSPASFITIGSGQSVDNTSELIQLAPATSYTIAESVLNSANADIVNNYNASYECTNATANSTTTMPKGNGNSFSLSNLDYGDEIVCTITNTPSQYTFSGTVFNDNGGLSGSPKNDPTNSFINSIKYFNGVFDEGESGIDGSALNNLKVRLTDCNSTDITGTTPQNVSDTGSYSFTIPASAVAGKSQVCLIQEEPDPWSYSVDTTPNRLEVPINNSVYLYEDNNFGEVIAEQTALVLKKYQYVHQCDANLNYNNILDKDSPLNGFSINAPRQDEKVDPGQCIAYKIEAYNHGHITLTDIRITDTLQKTPVESVFHLPNSSGIAASLRTTDNPTSGLVNIGDNGVIITEPFNLNNTAMTTTVSKRTLYFNTKYGN